jgi:predicted phage baseplate assembly protein
VAEVEAAGRAYLRFGDDRFGLRPARNTEFTASYRVGNGARGNVGADAIAYVVTDDNDVVAASNPLPAQGGIEPESIEEVRQNAPSAFRVQERAVTPEDYAEVAQRHPQVQRAAATIRWTGSWHTVFLTVDRFGGRPVDTEFEEELRAHLERYRLAGHDLEVDGPRYVPLEIEMLVCVLPEYFRSDVKATLLTVFGNQTLPDGRRGVFHPDNFTFGQPVYLSRLYEAAQAVEGVDWVDILRFRRQGVPDDAALAAGELTLHRLEIARLDNDPNFPENGVLRLVMEGGK